MTFSPETRLNALAHIRRQWTLPELSLEAQEAQEEALHRALASQVEDMLNNHFGQLVHALRRLDVRENDFHAAMHVGSSAEIAEALTVLILQREYEKAESRRRYKTTDNRQQRTD
jgi:hypothetical protein